MKKASLRALPLAAAIVLSFPVLAEDPALALEEVVVTAPRMVEPLTITTDPKAPRQPLPAHDGADYLKNIPGFSVIRKGGTDGDPVLRGLAGSRLNVLMDGENILGGCGMRMDPPTAYVFPESYDRVTVRKGPQTVRYGGGNLAGTVLFERDTQRFETAGTRAFGGLLVGSFARRDAVADVTAGAPTGYLRAIATRTTADDYEDGNGRKVHSDYTRWSGSLSGGFTPDATTRLEFSMDRSDGEASYADRMMDGTKFDRESYGLRFEKTQISAGIEKIEAQVFHHYVDHVMDNFRLRAKPMAAMYMINNPDRTTEGARVSSRFALPANGALTLGLDYQKNEHTFRSAKSMMAVPDIHSVLRAPDMTFRNSGVFGEADFALDEQNRLLAGLRLDRLKVDNEKSTGSGALASDRDRTWGAFVRHERAASAALTTFAGLGHAERPADWWERSTYNNFYLDPEKNTQLDAGLIYAAGAWRASLSGFYAKINDFILTRNNGTARNIDAKTWGFEADVGYALGSRWQATAALAWMRGENDSDGVALAQIPPLEGRLGLHYDDETWSFGAVARMVAEQDRVHVGYGSIVGQDLGPTAGFSVFSLNAGWRPRKGALITAGTDNVFDKTYAEHLSRAGAMAAGYAQTTRVNEPGRTFWLKASIAFDL